MNVVVTGATSFLGAAVIKELNRLHHQVFAVVRPKSRNRSALPELAGMTVIEMELNRLDEIASRIQEPCQVFIHLGWDGSGSENRRKAEVQQKNVTDSMKALEGAGKLGCHRFLFGGSQAEYGICREVMTETLPCHPVSEYGKAKLEFGRLAEKQCRSWQEAGAAKLEYLHTRIFSVYGPGDHPWSLVNTCLNTFLQGELMELGACTQQWNFLYIDDLAVALTTLALGESQGGIYNVAGGPEATMPLKAYVETMYEICGNRGSFTYGKRLPNAEGIVNLIPDITKLEAATGWKPQVDFKEGIERLLKMKKTCLICGEPLERKPLLQLKGMPASAQDIPDETEVGQDQGVTLKLHQCHRCGLVQFDCEPVGYFRDVIRSGGFTTTMVELRKRQYRHLIETYGLEGKKFIEVGCGRGEFLGVLSEFPVKAYGTEHKKDLAELARAQGLTVYHGFPETENTCLGEDGPYDVFLSFNFLEHQPNPGVMLDCIYENLTEDGMGLLTVPSLEYILQYDGYYELIRDHIAYYSFETLKTLLALHGFEVLEEEMVNRDTCSVIVRKAKGVKPDFSYEPVDMSGLVRSQSAIGEELQNLTSMLQSEGKTLAIWGASHQGFTLAATTCLGGFAQYIIDSAPFKQGRFAPASHLPILSPQQAEANPVDAILIVAPGYTQEIGAAARQRFGKEIRIMTLRSDHVEEWEEHR